MHTCSGQQPFKALNELKKDVNFILILRCCNERKKAAHKSTANIVISFSVPISLNVLGCIYF